jgi:hypothetical protein
MDRELIATGWGMHNNIGCMMAIMMPFGFYLASVHKKGWLFHLMGSGLLLGTMLSCSRTSMFVAMLAYLLCAVLLLRNPQSRRTNLWVYIGSVAAAAVVAILLADKIWSVFERFISQMGNISQRDNLIHYGIRQFLEEPLFGGSFYPQGKYVPWDWSNLDSFSSFFEELFSLRESGRTFAAPSHELFDVFDLKAGRLQALDDVECLDLAVRKQTPVTVMIQIREQTFLIIVTKC